MVRPAERHRELVADLAAERPRLRAAEMVRIRGLAPTHKARLRSDKFAMRLIAEAPRLPDRKQALVDAAPVGTGAVAAIRVDIDLARNFSSKAGLLPGTRCRERGGRHRSRRGHTFSVDARKTPTFAAPTRWRRQAGSRRVSV